MISLNEWAAGWKLRKTEIEEDARLGEELLRGLVAIIHNKLRIIQANAISSNGLTLISSILNFATELDNMSDQLPKSNLKQDVKKAASDIRDTLKEYDLIAKSSGSVRAKINVIFPAILNELKKTILKDVERELKTLEDLEREIGKAA